MKSKPAYWSRFKELGACYRRLRAARDMVQEDVIEYGFSVRHYQQLEAGRPHSLTTLFRIAEMYQVDPGQLMAGIDHAKPIRYKKKSSPPSPKPAA